MFGFRKESREAETQAEQMATLLATGKFSRKRRVAPLGPVLAWRCVLIAGALALLACGLWGLVR